MYPTEDDIRRNTEEMEDMLACDIAISICLGEMKYSKFTTINKDDSEYIKIGCFSA